MDKIEKLLKNTWTDNGDEKQILYFLRSVPLGQAKEFIARLTDRKVDGDSFLQALDDNVHGENNLLLHEALSEVRMKAINAETGSKNLANAMVIPWHDVMGFFETSLTFSANTLSNGKVRVKFHRGPMLLNKNEFSHELDSLPLELFVGGRDLDPDEIIIIHDYDNGRFIPLVAQQLIGYQHA